MNPHIVLLVLCFSRFKQLKEEEARKRKQREEEARNANLVAENNVPVTNGKLKTESNLVEVEDSKMESLYADDLLATENPSVNGNHSPQEVKDRDISSQRTEDDKSSSNGSFGKDDQQHLHENLRKARVCFIFWNRKSNKYHAFYERCQVLLLANLYKVIYLLCFEILFPLLGHVLILHSNCSC